MKHKSKAQSQIIGTVLLILIVISLIAILMGVVVPFVKNKLEETKCVDVTNQVQVVSSQYTCYNSTGKKLQVQIHIGDNKDLLDGFVISLGGASSKNFRITSDETPTDVFMLGDLLPLEIPGKTEERTFVINNTMTKPDSISVYPILIGGKTCDPPFTLKNIDFCLVP